MLHCSVAKPPPPGPSGALPGVSEHSRLCQQSCIHQGPRFFILPAHHHPVVKNHTLSPVYFSESKEGALLWKGGTHPILARWCFSSGRGEEKSTALLITSPQIKVLLHQSLNSHWRGGTSLQSFRFVPGFQLVKATSAPVLGLGDFTTTIPHRPFQKQTLLPNSTSTGCLCRRRNAHDGAPKDTQAGCFIWAANTLHWLLITELLPLS